MARGAGRRARRQPRLGASSPSGPTGPAEAGAVLRNSRYAVQLVAHTGAELADELHISHDTVRTHVRGAMTKLGARSRAHLVAKALGDGPLLA